MKIIWDKDIKYKDYKPERTWHKSIRHSIIYYKDNYLRKVKKRDIQENY